jgi:6-phosphogluconolactonase
VGLPRIAVFPDTSALAGEAARYWAEIARSAIAARGVFTVALAGGLTPVALYRLLAEPTPYMEAAMWAHTQIFFGDERCVPPDDSRSNYRLAREALLDHVAIPTDHVHRMRGEQPGPEAAAEYTETLQREFALSLGTLPRLDLILLGIGTDGHTASLFPNMPALEVSELLVVHSAVPNYVNPNVSRITLTFPVLNAAAHVLFLVTGAAKAAAVRDALTGPVAAQPLPASRVRPVNGTLTWLLDAGAASLLPPDASKEGSLHG